MKTKAKNFQKVEVEKTETKKEPLKKTETNSELDSELDRIMNDFNTKKSEFKETDFTDNVAKPETNGKTKIKAPTENSSDAEKENEISEEERKFNYESQKRIFIKIANFVIPYIHVVIYNLFSKIKIEYKDIKFTDAELQELDEYCTEEVVKVVDFIPEWIFPIIDIEMIMIDKINGAVKEKKKNRFKKEETKVDIHAESEAKYNEFLKWKDETINKEKEPKK